MAELARRSPLAGHGSEGRPPAWSGDGLDFAEIPFGGMLLVAGRPDAAVAQRLAAALGQDLPAAPGALHGAGPQVLMLAPSRWLVLAAPETTGELFERLADALKETGVAVHDVSDGRVEIEIGGALATELLAGATAIDLEIAAFPLGAVAQTQLARADALIRRVAADRFRIILDASYAEYAWRWLTTNAPLVIAARAPA